MEIFQFLMEEAHRQQVLSPQTGSITRKELVIFASIMDRLLLTLVSLMLIISCSVIRWRATWILDFWTIIGTGIIMLLGINTIVSIWMWPYIASRNLYRQGILITIATAVVLLSLYKSVLQTNDFNDLFIAFAVIIIPVSTFSYWMLCLHGKRYISLVEFVKFTRNESVNENNTVLLASADCPLRGSLQNSNVGRRRNAMNSRDVKLIVDEELERSDFLWNYHGITRENITSFLVEPYEVIVDPDDLETPPRPMWVVLHEYPGAADPGYLVVYDPNDPDGPDWGIAERYPNGGYVLNIGAGSLTDALNGM